MVDTGEKIAHESYGLIGCSRVSSTKGRPLFGSSIKHSNTITLRIRAAVEERHLNKNWYYGRDRLIEVEMSPTQFAEMITSLNMGEGVPCTLRYVDGERREDPPSTSQREVFEEEFKNDVNKVKSLYNKNYKEVQELLTKKGQLKAIEKKKVSTFLFELTRTIDDNLPFLQKSFNEAMDKTVHEAKGEVEAFVMNKVTSLGIEGLEKEMLKLSGGE